MYFSLVRHEVRFPHERRLGKDKNGRADQDTGEGYSSKVLGSYDVLNGILNPKNVVSSTAMHGLTTIRCVNSDNMLNIPCLLE